MEAVRRTRSFPDEALELVLPFISSNADLNSISLVCKFWYDTERWIRRHVVIGNCYAVTPSTLIRRFTVIRSITIKGKPYIVDDGIVPDGWGAHALPWISALLEAYPAMEEISLERMEVTDKDLELIGGNYPSLKVLVLFRCQGFTTHGLSSIAANCRNLRMLDIKSDVSGVQEDWISSFPDYHTKLEFLDLSFLKSKLTLLNLERLVHRSLNLKTLLLNHDFPLENLIELLPNLPQLVDLGTGLFTMESCPEAYRKLATAFEACKGLKSLSGLLEVNPYYLPAIYPVCSRLTFLNVSDSKIFRRDLIKLLRHCPNLQRLWVRLHLDDRVLEEAAASCKELQELKVFHSFLDDLEFDDSDYDFDSDSDDDIEVLDNLNPELTERGLVSIALSCPKLHDISYLCTQMTNAALFTIAKHLPNLTCLMINIRQCDSSDYLNKQPFDSGFSAIIENCKNLKRLLVCGSCTDGLLNQIATHGKKLEMLELIYGSETNTDSGLNQILFGCTNLMTLSVINCPFDCLALIVNANRLERMQSVWMSSATLTFLACKMLCDKNPRLNVEVFFEGDSDVKSLYVYRTIAGPRLDKPKFVIGINEKKLPEQ